jgi:hypothetical protein
MRAGGLPINSGWPECYHDADSKPQDYEGHEWSFAGARMLLSSFMDRVVDRLERLTSRQSAAVLTLCLAAVVLINGIGLVPPEHYQRISLNPFVTRTDIAPANYWQADILLPLIGFFTHWNGQFSFNLLCFVIILGGYLLFARFAIQRAGTAAGVVLTCF